MAALASHKAKFEDVDDDGLTERGWTRCAFRDGFAEDCEGGLEHDCEIRDGQGNEAAGLAALRRCARRAENQSRQRGVRKMSPLGQRMMF